MATYAIGDIQGCFDEFQRLLAKLKFDQSSDRLWLVGDLVNRGPKSLVVLRLVRNLGASAVTVLGNHDLHLLMLAESDRHQRDDDTLADVLAASDREELLLWLRQQPLMHVERGFAMVHAGLLPQWSVEQARMLAGEVESALSADSYRDFLAHMRGSEPKAWQDDLAGWARLRVIVNGMTPWFEVPQRRSADHTLITGHWSALGLKIAPGLLALDSGCFWGGQLSAVRLEDQALFQVACGKT
ncbi:MAG: symmetrical bis(5'-nucleosyl)-tetraphosphatase [Proteobacteria bacterium]|nr:symmetrical bis(5'-nucleosyl)-tetraphosphatase [Pseudomonadota bacterium]